MSELAMVVNLSGPKSVCSRQARSGAGIKYVIMAHSECTFTLGLGPTARFSVRMRDPNASAAE
jgi:hypothetical protein